MSWTWWWLLPGACGGVVALSCGGQSVRHVSGDESGAAASGQGGGPQATGGNGGEPSTGGTTPNTGGTTPSTGGTAAGVGGTTPNTGGDAPLGGSASTGGTSTQPPPDFDLTPEPNAAVTYLIDPAHTGAQMAEGILPPFALEVALRYEGAVSYPLIVGTRIFFTADDATYGIPTVHAIERGQLEEAWQVTPFRADEFATPAHLAYDRGLVFVADWNGHVAALDARSGAMVWQTALDTYGAVSVPVAAGGAVFLTGATASGSSLFALHAGDGSLLYRVPSQAGHPTLGNGNVLTTSDCNETRAALATTGGERWHYVGACGGGTHPGLSSFWGGRVFSTDDTGTVSVVYTASGTHDTELEMGWPFWPMTFGEAPLAVETFAPELDGPPVGLVGYDSTLHTKSTLVPITEGFPRLPPVATPHYVFALLGEHSVDQVGDPAAFVALDPEAGTIAWRDDEVSFPGDPGWQAVGGSPLPGMAVGSGYIAVGMDRTLAVFASLNLR